MTNKSDILITILLLNDFLERAANELDLYDRFIVCRKRIEWFTKKYQITESDMSNFSIDKYLKEYNAEHSVNGDYFFSNASFY